MHSGVVPVLLAVAFWLSASTTALALPNDPLEPPSVDRPAPFVPWPNGFDWNVPSRFGAYRDGIVDFHWDEATHTYDPAYVNPSSFPVQFDGCASANDEAANGNLANDYTYTWSVPGATSAPPANHTCQFTALYPSQGTYTAVLGVRPTSGTTTSTFTQAVVVKDWLIASIGDSYASGEGNPDVPQQFDGAGFVRTGARWEDRRCHRSASAGAAQAALAIEMADPKTSVTFISLACSGATIDRGTFADDDPEKPQGSGILGPYRGVEPPAGTSYDPADWLPPQVTALATTAAGRQIDALIISGGGNDMGFANLASTCVLNGRCWDATVHFDFDPTLTDGIPLWAVVQRQAGLLPTRYDLLASAINNPNPTGRPAIHATHVFATEYPDSTRTDDGAFCPDILDDIVGWPATMTATESQWAMSAFLQPLNTGIQQSAASHSTPAGEAWHYVGGVSNAFAGGGVGHGYCASNSWIRRASDSIRLEGPWYPYVLPTRDTKGTLHPTAEGHRAYRDRILAGLLPLLVSPAPPATPLPPAPGFAETITGTRGSNGWITSSGNILTITAQASANNIAIRGTSVSVDGTPGCAVAGVTCSTQAVAPTAMSPGSYSWSFTVTAEGIHHLAFSASDANGMIQNYAKELKVDLADPGTPTYQLASAPNAAGWYRQPVGTTFASTDSVQGSGAVFIEYHVDGGAAAFVTTGAAATFSTDGRHMVTYQAVDQAGRRSASQSFQLNVDQTPPQVTVNGVTDGATYMLGSVPAAGCTTTDSVSGVATPAALQVTGGSANGVGRFTVDCGGAADAAGNTGSTSASYIVDYTFRGFLSPVDSPPTLNTGKAGRTYAVKFQLTSASGAFVSSLSAVNALTVKANSCAAFGSDPTDALEVEATGSTILRYDATANQYIYNWSTPKTPGCYTLTVSLDSGQIQTAFFSLS